MMSHFFMGCFSYQASKDDISVYSALATSPSADYVNVARWYNHIDALLKLWYVLSLGLLQSERIGCSWCLTYLT